MTLWFRQLRFKRRCRATLSQPLGTVSTPATLLTYFDLLQDPCVQRYQPAKGLQVEMTVVTRNIIHLSEALESAIDTVGSNQTVTTKGLIRRDVQADLRQVRVDDYLIDHKHLPVSFTEVVHHTHLQLTTLERVLHQIKEKSEHRYEYYLRQYTHLFNETHVVLRGFLEAI